ncbi:MAG TPA: hypothetical protein VK191_16590 [Symbiobacteriaceae bacterium]|nr:hypothetical protein [Symbiobacteriaceae bacterium]
MAAARLGLELIAARPLDLSIGTFFETWLAAADGTVRRSLGRDEYHLTLRIEAGGRLAATGRTYVCQFDRAGADMGANEALPTRPVDLGAVPTGLLLLALRTNCFLSLRELQEGAAIRLNVGGQARGLLPLNEPPLRCDQVAPGRYLIDLTEQPLD